MSFQAEVLQVLIASPSDLKRERQALPDIIQTWNSLHAFDLKILLQPVMWERDTTPSLTGRPQAIINEQIVRDCDILIAAFWTRLGTSTGEADSGTVEEIQEFQKAGKPILIYFSSAPVRLESVDAEQYENLQMFRRKLQSEGLIETYDELAEFREKVLTHLTRTVRRFKAGGNLSMRVDEALVQMSQSSVQSIKQQWTLALNRFGAEWVNERESQPLSFDIGKDILYRFCETLLEFRTYFRGKVAAAFLTDIDLLIRRIQETLQLRNVADREMSYQGFWDFGDEVFDRVRQLGARIEGSSFAEQTAAGAVNGVPATFTYLGTAPKPLTDC